MGLCHILNSLLTVMPIYARIAKIKGCKVLFFWTFKSNSNNGGGDCAYKDNSCLYRVQAKEL